MSRRAVVSDTDRELLDKALAIAEASVSRYKAGKRINDPSSLKTWARLFYAGIDPSREHFTVVCLNTRHKLLGAEVLFSGAVDGCDISVAVVARHVLSFKTCTAIFLVHNHPSGDLTPSTADHALTARIQKALALFDIKVLDHLIVHGADSTSFAERGHL